MALKKPAAAQRLNQSLFQKCMYRRHRSRLLGSTSIGHSGSDTHILSSLHSDSYRKPHGSLCGCGLQKLPLHRKSSSAAWKPRLLLSFAWSHSVAEIQQAHLTWSEALPRINSFAILHFQYIVKTLLRKTSSWMSFLFSVCVCAREPTPLLYVCVCEKGQKAKKRKRKKNRQELNCLSLKVVYSNQAVWETWMDRCMLGNSTGLWSKAC